MLSFFTSRDLAFFDEEGYCTIIGRKKDMLIRRGENIYPAEIEQVLYKHPCVVDVQVFCYISWYSIYFLFKLITCIEIQIIGVPDKRLGEQVAAWIILKDGSTTTEQDIRDYCKDKVHPPRKHPHSLSYLKCLTFSRQMAYFKLPYYITFVKNYPLTITGKVQKYKMRKEALRLYNLEHLEQ